jgi:hypothetical protein
MMPPVPSRNPLDDLSQAYGIWYGAMEKDPSGDLFRIMLKNAVVGAAVGGAAGHVLPTFKAVDGAKWGALVGAAQTVWYYVTK